MDDSLFGEQALDEAFDDAAEYQAQKLASLLDGSAEYPTHIFSDTYQQAIKKALKPRRRSLRLLRVASFLLVCCIGFGAAVFQVEAIREPFARFFLKMTNEYTSITFDGDVGAQSLPSNINAMLPTQLPKGYTVTELESEYDWFLHAVFTGEDGTELMYSVMPTGGSTAFDTEDCIFYETTIGTRKTYVSIKQTFHNVLILMFDNEFTYFLSGPVEEDLAIGIMESVP